MRTLAIVPVKRFALAKQRLRPDVGEAEREALAAAMVADVLAALDATKTVEATLVITNEPAVARLAPDMGAEALPDPHERGQSAAAGVGIARALELGYKRVLLAPGDCPALAPGELDELLATVGDTAVLIVPDRHGAGTNALVLTPPDAIEPSFGPGSCQRHRGLADRAGVASRVVRVPSLLLDVDTPHDLNALRAALERHAGGASRTRALLARG